MKKVTYYGVTIDNGTEKFDIVINEYEATHEGREYTISHDDYLNNPVGINYSKTKGKYNVSYGSGGSSLDDSVRSAIIKAESLILAAGMVKKLEESEVYYEAFNFEGVTIEELNNV